VQCATARRTRRSSSRILDEDSRCRIGDHPSSIVISKLRPAISRRDLLPANSPSGVIQRERRRDVSSRKHAVVVDRLRKLQVRPAEGRASGTERAYALAEFQLRVLELRHARLDTHVSRWSAPQRSRRRLDVSPLAPVSIYPHCATLLGTCFSFTLSLSLSLSLSLFLSLSLSNTHGKDGERGSRVTDQSAQNVKYFHSSRTLDLCVSSCVCLRVPAYACIYVCMCMCMCMCAYACVCVCVCVD
jgi:hypothetical protein